MDRLTRRSILRASARLAAVGAIARPFVANAEAKAATVWWVQGFAEEEDIGFKQLVVKFKQMVPIGSESFRGISIWSKRTKCQTVPLACGVSVRIVRSD